MGFRTLFCKFDNLTNFIVSKSTNINYHFSFRWTSLGKDTSLRLQASESSPPNHILNGILLATTVFGFFGSPALLALWVKDMKQCRDKISKK